jgi:hypothetical protein
MHLVLPLLDRDVDVPSLVVLDRAVRDRPDRAISMHLLVELAIDEGR